MDLQLVRDILQSQSAWTNFWTFLSGLIGALVGAGTSYFFQNRSESRKLIEERKGMFLKYSIFCDRIYGTVSIIHKNALASKTDDPIRHINIPPIHAIFPDIDVKDPAVELFFLIEKNEVGIIGKLLNIKQRYAGLVDFINIRNELVLEKLQPIVVSHDIANRNLPKEQILTYVGQPLFGKLESATNALFDDSKYILENYAPVKAEMKRVFKAVFGKKAKMIELFNQ